MLFFASCKSLLLLMFLWKSKFLKGKIMDFAL